MVAVLSPQALRRCRALEHVVDPDDPDADADVATLTGRDLDTGLPLAGPGARPSDSDPAPDPATRDQPAGHRRAVPRSPLSFQSPASDI